MKLILIITLMTLVNAMMWADDEVTGLLKTERPQEKEGVPKEFEEERAALLKKNFTLEATLKLHGQGYIQNGEENARLNASTISLVAKYKDLIKGVIIGKLDHQFIQNGESVNESMTIEDFIKEAYIEIHNIGGKPVAFVFGKQVMAFGQQYFPMPFWTDGALYNLQVKKEVIGLTIRLDKEMLMGIFDKAEVSWFENKPKDLNIGTMDGVSVRLTKKLLEQLQLTLSSLYAGNDYLEPAFQNETRQAVGLVYKNKTGTFSGYVEGIYFEHNPKFPNSNIGLTAGTVIKVSKESEVVIEFSLINDYLRQYSIAYRIALTKNISFGPEIMYWDYTKETSKNKDGFFYGLDLTMMMDTGKNSYYDNYLFGHKK
ncbi:MAG: hypothetical protein WCG27_08045 [Pseudomonadota bacterium]